MELTGGGTNSQLTFFHYVYFTIYSPDIFFQEIAHYNFPEAKSVFKLFMLTDESADTQIYRVFFSFIYQGQHTLMNPCDQIHSPWLHYCYTVQEANKKGKKLYKNMLIKCLIECVQALIPINLLTVSDTKLRTNWKWK